MALQRNDTDPVDFSQLFEEGNILRPEEIEELKKYYEDVENMFDHNIGLEFKNEGKYHATIVMGFIFAKAKESIKIFAGDYNGSVCDNKFYLDNLSNAIQQGKSLEVLFEKNPNVNSKGFKLIKELRSQFPGMISIKVAEPAKIKTFLKHQVIHFTIGDDTIYRCEIDTNSYKAVCDFNDKLFTRKLINLFMALSEDAKEVN